MIGVALEGGAERSSFTAGVMDALMAHDFYAGAASGTSAGAGCVLNYRSGQQGVALEMMIMERHSRYFGIRHMAHTGRFLNLDHMAHEYASRISWDAYRHPSMQTFCRHLLRGRQAGVPHRCRQQAAPVYSNQGILRPAHYL